jgi:DNA-binding GntR family transcriptional regulator
MLAGKGEPVASLRVRDGILVKGAYSKADAVYGELKSAILTGALEPGRLIDKEALCRKLGVSRHPVSTAVGRLAYDQLVDVAPQHGSFVSRISLNDVRERLFIRCALESEIAAEAATRMTKADKEALAAALSDAEAAVSADDRAAFYVADVAFHQLLTARLKMARAAEVLDGLRVHLERVRRILMSPPGRIREVLAEHRAVAEAIEASDAAAAREAMKQHLGVTGALLDKVAREQPGLFVE